MRPISSRSAQPQSSPQHEQVMQRAGHAAAALALSLLATAGGLKLDNTHPCRSIVGFAHPLFIRHPEHHHSVASLLQEHMPD